MKTSASISYSELLRDPRWQKKRLQILSRDNWTCLECGDKTSTLHVHHLFYVHGCPWATPDFGLRTLCEDCHASASHVVAKEDGIDQYLSTALILIDLLREWGLGSAEALNFAYQLSCLRSDEVAKLREDLPSFPPDEEVVGIE